MRKQIAIAMAICMLFALVSPSFASVGTKVDGVKRAVADINFSGTNTGGAVTVDGNGLNFNPFQSLGRAMRPKQIKAMRRTTATEVEAAEDRITLSFSTWKMSLFFICRCFCAQK